MNQKILRILGAVLALADGVLHFALDYVLFRGNLFGNPFGGGPPPGAPPRGGGGPPALPLPLNQLFVLNFVGAIILVAFYWLAPRWLGKKGWLANVVLIAYEAATFVGWWLFGRPNPMNLGYLSKGIEIGAMAVLAVGVWKALNSRDTTQTAT